MVKLLAVRLIAVKLTSPSSPGYCLPDGHFNKMVRETVQKLMTVLRDPILPLLELQVKDLKHLIFIYFPNVHTLDLPPLVPFIPLKHPSVPSSLQTFNQAQPFTLEKGSNKR